MARTEHDYRDLKHGLGLDHFESRTCAGWYHQLTLVTAAHLFITIHPAPERRPNSPRGSQSFSQLLTEL